MKSGRASLPSWTSQVPKCMVVLRPVVSENHRFTLTNKYEELLVAGAGGGMALCGCIPQRGRSHYHTPSRRKAKLVKLTLTWMPSLSLIFTYFTKPESLRVLDVTLQADDDVVRSMSF